MENTFSHQARVVVVPRRKPSIAKVAGQPRLELVP